MRAVDRIVERAEAWAGAQIDVLDNHRGDCGSRHEIVSPSSQRAAAGLRIAIARPLHERRNGSHGLQTLQQHGLHAKQ
jgi:hypothetical protein